MYICEWFETLADEVKYVWRGRFSLVSLLYAIIRVSLLLHIIFFDLYIFRVLESRSNAPVSTERYFLDDEFTKHLGSVFHGNCSVVQRALCTSCWCFHYANGVCTNTGGIPHLPYSLWTRLSPSFPCVQPVNSRHTHSVAYRLLCTQRSLTIYHTLRRYITEIFAGIYHRRSGSVYQPRGDIS